MSKYSYLVITTKSGLSEEEHAKILNNYGLQGYRVLHQRNGIFGRITYTLEKASEAKPVSVNPERSPIANLRPHELLIVPSKYIYEVTDILVKGIEASKDMPLEVKKLLTEWISINRYDLAQKYKEESNNGEN